MPRFGAAFWVAVCLALVAPALPAAQATRPSIIALVDVQRILQEASAARTVQQQLEDQRSKFQTEITAEEADLRKAEQKLAKLRDSAQADVYAEEEQKLRQRFLTVERHVQARRKALDQAFTDSMNAVRKGIVDIVTAVSKEKGVNLAIVKQQVIWNDQSIDITDEVLARLNKDMPKIQVKVLSDEEIMDDPPVVLNKNKAKAPRK